MSRKVINIAMSKNDIYTILDIGTAKTLCLMTRITSKEEPEVIGIGRAPSQGINSGAITDMKKAIDAVEIAVRDAEQMARERVKQVYLSISSYNTFSLISKVEVMTEGSKITEHDIQNLTRKCLITEKNNISTIHCIPIDYTIDGLSGISNPIGMQGKRLGAQLHIIAAYKSRLRNISQCCINITSYIASAYSTGFACLNQNERNIGSIILDIGAKSTTIAAYQDNNIIYSDFVPLGGLHITKDIACGLSISIEQAERVKTSYGSALEATSNQNELIEISDSSSSQNNILVSKATINSIINARTEEIFELVRNKLKNASIDESITGRVILTGGCSKLLKIQELAARIMRANTRIGTTAIKGIDESDLSYAAAIGTIMFIKEKLGAEKRIVQVEKKGLIENFWQWIKEAAN
jgi:cell division protein FtsA